jgi:parvulin-like peptidyl-prolyl isomerase
MRISVKMVLLVVCISAGLVFGAAKDAKNVKVENKDTKAAVKDANTAVKPEVKETKPEVKVEAKEAKPAAPAAKAVEPGAVAENTGVAVTVNGKDIAEADVDAKINTYMERAASQIPPGMIDQYKKQMRPKVVESMVMEQLLAEQIKKANINITDADVNDKITEIISSQPGMTMETFKAMIASRGQSFDEVKEQIKKTMSYEKLIGNAEIPDAEAKAFYDENKADFNKPEQVKASHILVKVDASATPEQKAAAKTKAEGLLKKVKAGGDFAALAKENSDCPSKDRGGDLGFFDKGTMVKEFADAAFAMKVGDISNVVETQFGYHIIKVTDRQEGGMMSFDKAKTDIVKQLQDKKKSELFKQLIEKVKAEAKIVYPPGKEPKPIMPMMPQGQGQRPNGPPPQPESAPAPK